MRPRLQRPADWSSAPLPSCPVTKYPSAAQALPLQSDRPPPPAPPPRPAPYQPDTLPHVNPGIELLSKSKFGNELGRTPSDAQSDVPSKSIAVSPLNSDDRERVGSNGYGAKTGGAITTAETTVRQPASARLNAVRGVADRGGVGIVEGRDARPSGAASAGSSVGAERGIAESQANELVTVPRASGVGEATEGGRKALPDQLQTIRPQAPPRRSDQPPREERTQTGPKDVQTKSRASPASTATNPPRHVPPNESPTSSSSAANHGPTQTASPARLDAVSASSRSGLAGFSSAPRKQQQPPPDSKAHLEARPRPKKLPAQSSPDGAPKAKRARIKATWTPVHSTSVIPAIGRVGHVRLGNHDVLLRLDPVPVEEWLGDVPRPEQIDTLLSTLEANDEYLEGPNVTLREDPTATDAAAYTVLALALNRTVLVCDDPHHSLPPSTSLNRQLATGTSSMSYFTYYTWFGIHGASASQKFDRYAKLPQWRNLAKKNNLHRYFDRWLANLPTTTNGWNRKAGYVGYSDGFDHLKDDDAEPYWRVPAHFVKSASAATSLHKLVLFLAGEFKRENPEFASDCFLFLSILSSANELDKQTSHADMMEVEALHAAAARTHTGNGGLNCAPCGSLGANGLLDALDHLDDDELVVSEEIPYVLYDMIRQRYPGAVNLKEVRNDAALRQKEAETRAEERRSAADPAQTKAKSLRAPRFSKTSPKLRKKRKRVPVRVTSNPRNDPAATQRERRRNGSSSGPEANPFRRRNNKFSADDDKLIVALHNEGLSTRQIGAQLSPAKDNRTVHLRLDLLLNRGGPTYYVYTQEEDKEIILFYDTDRSAYPFSKITKKLGLNEDQVKNRWRRLRT